MNIAKVLSSIIICFLSVYVSGTEKSFFGIIMPGSGTYNKISDNKNSEVVEFADPLIKFAINSN